MTGQVTLVVTLAVNGCQHARRCRMRPVRHCTYYGQLDQTQAVCAISAAGIYWADEPNGPSRSRSDRADRPAPPQQVNSFAPYVGMIVLVLLLVTTCSVMHGGGHTAEHAGRGDSGC